MTLPECKGHLLQDEKYALLKEDLLTVECGIVAKPMGCTTHFLGFQVSWVPTYSQ